jgi:hypothetical protein
VVPQLSGGWQQKCSTKTRQVGLVSQQSIYFTLSVDKTLSFDDDFSFLIKILNKFVPTNVYNDHWAKLLKLSISEYTLKKNLVNLIWLFLSMS